MFGLEAKDAVQLGLTLLAQATAVAAWLRKPGQDAQTKVDAMDGRVIALEERIKHMPDSEELAKLEGAVTRIDERTKGLSEAIDTIRASQARVEQYLLNNAAR